MKIFLYIFFSLCTLTGLLLTSMLAANIIAYNFIPGNHLERWLIYIPLLLLYIIITILPIFSILELSVKKHLLICIITNMFMLAAYALIFVLGIIRIINGDFIAGITELTSGLLFSGLSIISMNFTGKIRKNIN